MKNIFLKSFAVLAAGFMLGACDKNAIEDYNEPANSGAYIKFAHAAAEAPAVNFYLGSTKVSALAPKSSGELQGLEYTASPVFPASYGYANVAAGNQTLQAIATPSAGGAVVANAQLTLNEGDYYTSYLVGGNGAFETLTLQDELPAENYTQSHIRFVNLMQGAAAGINATVIRKATSETPEARTGLGSAIAVKGNTAYVGLEPQGSFEVEFKQEGSETVLLKTSSFSPLAGRVYTIVLRGSSAEAASAVLYRDR